MCPQQIFRVSPSMAVLLLFLTLYGRMPLPSGDSHAYPVDLAAPPPSGSLACTEAFTASPGPLLPSPPACASPSSVPCCNEANENCTCCNDDRQFCCAGRAGTGATCARRETCCWQDGSICPEFAVCCPMSPGSDWYHCCPGACGANGTCVSASPPSSPSMSVSESETSSTSMSSSWTPSNAVSPSVSPSVCPITGVQCGFLQVCCAVAPGGCVSEISSCTPCDPECGKNEYSFCCNDQCCEWGCSDDGSTCGKSPYVPPAEPDDNTGAVAGSSSAAIVGAVCVVLCCRRRNQKTTPAAQPPPLSVPLMAATDLATNSPPSGYHPPQASQKPQ